MAAVAPVKARDVSAYRPNSTQNISQLHPGRVSVAIAIDQPLSRQLAAAKERRLDGFAEKSFGRNLDALPLTKGGE